MREILFRGKSVRYGGWTDGFYARLYDDKGNISHRIYSGYSESDCGDFYPEWFEVDPATIGQYTGLKDKNGKRIFEGDIVNGLFIFERSVAGVVEFRGGAFGVKWMRGAAEEFYPFTSCCNVTWEVIGNVHDTPELLEGEAGG